MAIPPVLDTTVVYRIDKSLALAGMATTRPLTGRMTLLLVLNSTTLNDIDDRVHFEPTASLPGSLQA